MCYFDCVIVFMLHPVQNPECSRPNLTKVGDICGWLKRAQSSVGMSYNHAPVAFRDNYDYFVCALSRKCS